jgi:16S rRNA (cytidine1402-2'-O)-methyltransferase
MQEDLRRKQGRLYLCSTPIGNLEDITLRAIRILKEVDLIVAEDTRHSRKLLKRYGIKTPFTSSYYQGVEEKRAKQIIAKLKEGKDIALICNSGTPLISDPGYPLVKKAISEGIEVVPIPGPVALIAALVVSGIPPSNFIFDGTPPKKKKKKVEYFKKIKPERRTVILYESPHRIIETLEVISSVLGEREMALCRELTKIHEEVLYGSPREILKELKRRGGAKGEMVLVIKGA